MGSKVKHPTPHPPAQVRIIGGQWKRTPLPVANREGLRPTLSRVRETLFNWIDVTGWRCFDAFAGTGALGFEAASRGASFVQMVELDAALCLSLQKTITKLKAEEFITLRQGDGYHHLERIPTASLELIFLDPPFNASHFYSKILKEAQRTLVSGGMVYLESSQNWFSSPWHEASWELVKAGQAGGVHFSLVRRL